MASEENIKVVVRLRPFLQNLKEETEGKSKRIVHMDELSSTVSVSNPKNPADILKFMFDTVLWSFDGYTEQADGYLAADNKTVSEEMYCDQKQVYEEIGKEIIHNLWNGYSSSLFTFGESKSGKSWTLLGLGANKGIIPQALTDLFKGVREKEKLLQQNGSSLEVRISMVEIYNEKVKDLLPASATANTTAKMKSALKIREHSKKGFYVESVRHVLVVNHEDIQQRLEEGLVNRAVFLTSCNASAENSMTVITITLVQRIRNHRGDEVTRVASLEAYDLPACEFVGNDSKNDMEDKDFPGCLHNNLRRNGVHCLSSCVDQLLEASIGKYQDPIAFHRHVVTKLLKNSLSGNSKTWMLVTLSPSNYSYKRSLFILQLAEKVRMLTTRSILNEEVTSKLTRELKAENEKLRKMITLGDIESNEYFSYKIEQMEHACSGERETLKRKITEDMKAQIRENDKEIRNLQQSFEERVKAFKTEKNDLNRKIENDRKNKCHIYNMNADSQASGKIVQIIPLGTVDFGHVPNNGGNGKTKENNHVISFCGPGIQEHHGTFSYSSKDGKISIKAAGPNCRILVNETLIIFDTVLAHNDRIFLGGTQMWVYQNPKETWLEKYAFSYKMYYEYFMEDVAIKSNYYQKFNNTDSLSETLQKQLINLIPALEDAKLVVEDLNQNFTFDPLLLQPIDILLRDNNGDSHNSDSGTGSSTYKTDYGGDYAEDHPEKAMSLSLLIKVKNSVDGTFTYWSYDKFFDRLEMLKDAYMQFLEDGEIPLKEIDALKETSEMDLPIGYSIISLKPLAYLINLENSVVPILDFVTFQPIGTIYVSMHFCDDNGEKIHDGEVFIESVEELLDDNLTIVMSIKDIQSVNLQFKEIYCKYKFLEENEQVTKYLDTKGSSFMGVSNKYEKKYVIEPVTDNTLNLMLTQHLVLKFFGKQRSHKLLNLVGNFSTFGKHYAGGRSSYSPVDMENTMAQLKIKEKAEQRHLQRLGALKALIDQSETLGEEAISVNVVRSLFEAKNKKFVDESLEEHKEILTALQEEPEPKQLPPELKALKRFSEVCCIC